GARPGRPVHPAGVQLRHRGGVGEPQQRRVLAGRVARRPASRGPAVTDGVASRERDTSGSQQASPEGGVGATPPVGAPGAGPARRRRFLGAVRYVGRRVLVTATLLLGVTVMTFLLVQLVPGDAASANLSESALANPEIVAAYRAKWGL